MPNPFKIHGLDDDHYHNQALSRISTLFDNDVSSALGGDTFKNNENNNKSAAALIIEAVVAIGGMIFNGVMQHRQNRENRRAVEEANAQALAQWQRETAYDSPINQRKRLEQAFLNPAMMYGGIENVSANSPSMSVYQGQAPQVDTTNTIGALRQIREDELLQAQIDNINADTDKKRSDIGLNEFTIQKGGYEIKLIGAQTETEKYKLKVMGQDILESMSRIDLNNKNLDLITEQILNQKFINDHINPATLKEIESRTGLNEAQVKDLQQTFTYRIALLKAEASNQYSQSQLARANAKYQQLLNDSPGYVQSVVDCIKYDAKQKQFSFDLDVAKNQGKLDRYNKFKDESSLEFFMKPRNAEDFVDGLGYMFDKLMDSAGGLIGSIVGKL